MTTAPQPASSSVNRRMAKVVVWNTRHLPVAEVRELLEILGLIEPGGSEILPDDKRNLTVAPCSDDDARAPKGPLHLHEPRKSSAPPGLYAVPKPQPRRGETRRPPADRKPPERKPPRERERAQCGTYAGWTQHQLQGSDACPACQAARDKRLDYHREYDAARRARKKAEREQAAAETPTEGAASPDAVGTAPAPSDAGHGYAGPDAQPQVSPSRTHHGEDGEPGASDAPAGPPVAEDQDDVVDAEILSCEDCPRGDCYGCDAIAPAPPPPPVVVPVDLDKWIGAAQRNPARPVQRAAAVAVTALLQLRIAMDDLARAERAAARGGAA